jgi:hypothetical protein
MLAKMKTIYLYVCDRTAVAPHDNMEELVYCGGHGVHLTSPNTSCFLRIFKKQEVFGEVFSKDF